MREDAVLDDKWKLDGKMKNSADDNAVCETNEPERRVEKIDSEDYAHVVEDRTHRIEKESFVRLSECAEDVGEAEEDRRKKKNPRKGDDLIECAIGESGEK